MAAKSFLNVSFCSLGKRLVFANFWVVTVHWAPHLEDHINRVDGLVELARVMWHFAS